MLSREHDTTTTPDALQMEPYVINKVRMDDPAVLKM